MWRRRGNGGAEGIRTPDLCSAIAALSQLSYGPNLRVRPFTLGAQSLSRRAIEPCSEVVLPVKKCHNAPQCRAQGFSMNPIVWLILNVLEICFWIVIVSAVLSWLIAFNVVNTRNQVVGTIAETLWRLTEPMLAPIRRFLPPLGGIDLSPLVLLVLIRFLQQVVIWAYAQL